MISVPGFHFSGDLPKAKVSLQLAGLTDEQYYVLGEQIEGELGITPSTNMQLSRITFELTFLIRGMGMSSIIQTETFNLPVPKLLKGNQLHKFPVQIPYRFQRPSYKGEFLNSFWQLNVLLNYDSRQNTPTLITRVLTIVTQKERHGTSFEILVKHGKGAYRATKKELPIGFMDTLPLPSLNTLSWTLPLVGFFSFLMLDGRIKLEDTQVILIFLLVVAIVLLIIRLSIFQMTPMELRPLRDGQLRLRILDRGNGQMEKAIVGYRLLEYYMLVSEGKETQKKKALIENSFPLAEVAHREEYFYEAVLPWPEVDLPLTGGKEGLGYEWEVFIQVPHPITRGNHEKSWPVEVGWERLRLLPPTTEELEQEELEVLKLKELEHLPRT